MLLLVLIIDLHIKLGWEETMLSEKFEDYHAYQKQSKKLIPFIY
jgi:protein-S-isoprenylcysteine O-methyltransferase Ste14